MQSPVNTARDILVVALALAGPGVIALASQVSVRGRQADVGHAAPWLFAFIVLVSVIWLFGVRNAGRKPGDVGIVWPPTAASLLLATALTVFFVFVYGPLVYDLFARLGLSGFEQGQARLAALPPWYLALAIVIVAGSEEWLYRGLAIPLLERLTGNVWLAAAISLLAFALAHLPLWGVGASLSTLVAGVIFTALFIWRRDATGLIIAHIATDLYGLLIAPIFAGNV